jgi:hypothetical protein
LVTTERYSRGGRDIDKMFLNRVGGQGQHHIEIAVDNVTYLDGKSEKPKVRAWRL